MLSNVLGDISTFGAVEELTSHDAFVPLQPGVFAVIESCERIGDDFERFRLFANAYNLTWFYAIGSDIDHLTVDHYVAMAHQLTGSGTGGSESETVNDIVKTAFEHLEEHLTGDATRGSSAVEEVAELSFEHTIGVLSLLLLGEHHAIFRRLAATAVAMLSGREIATRKHFVGSEDCLAETTGDTRLWSNISCHISVFLFSLSVMKCMCDW